MSRLTFEELMSIDELHADYIDALDSKDMGRWLATFAHDADASYICISRDNVEQGLELAMMLDDNRARIHDRGTFINEIWVGTFQDYRTRHFAQRVHAERLADGTASVRSHFTVLYTPDDVGTSEVLATGTYEDVVQLAPDDGSRLKSRRAVMDTVVLPRYLVFPL